MTEKQQRILEAALRLFAQEGYAATSTSKVAKAAGVSEGLIFRHFQSKEGLLQAILTQAHEMTRQAFAGVVLASDPKETIRKILELPYTISEAHYEMWRLVYALKWQTKQYDTSSYDPIRLVLQHAFAELGYADPAAEAELVFMYLDGAATAMLLHPPAQPAAVLEALKKKYNL
ncbi:MAG: TetR/AcrR family transcriptional regulator [Bacteroidetes bacterium]|nr:MAG: TetR/AcrR family transcriptional regulator [Bacteroidota bacterium]